VNLTVPFLEVDSALGEGTGRGQAEFAPGATPGLPSRSQIVEWYVAAAGWDPSEDIEWGDAFGMFRATVIVQGIAARYATRQSSGLDAMRISTQIEPFAEYTARLIRRLQGRRKARTKL
jgi:aminoglycoside phosphotransferase (APT) family kinase protein